MLQIDSPLPPIVAGPGGQVRIWYVELIERLLRLELYVPANQIIKRSDDAYVRQMSEVNNT